jgi:hypothetical protein
LRAFVSQFLGKGNFCADVQFVKLLVEHAVGVKVDFMAICGLNETVAAVAKDITHTTVRWSRMVLYRASLPAHVFFKFAGRGIKGIAYSSIQVLIQWIMLRRCLDNGNFLARHFDIKPYLTGVSLPVMEMRHIDHHATTHNAFAEFLQLRRFSSDSILNDVDAIQIVKADLHGKFHFTALRKW